MVVFDLGGTTVHDRGEVPAAFSDALREAGVAFDPAELAAWRGASKYEILRRLLTRQRDGTEVATTRVDHIYGHFRTGLAERLMRARPLSLPGVRQVFECLRAGGIRVAVASGFDRQIIELVLGAVDWADLLDARVC
ncbi:MAG: HAD family hydrolase, partial [Gemmatimonadales bacterium]